MVAPLEIPGYFLIEIIIFITLVIIVVYGFVDRDNINNEISDSNGNTDDISNNEISDFGGNTGDISNDGNTGDISNNEISDSGGNTGENKEVFNAIDLTPQCCKSSGNTVTLIRKRKKHKLFVHKNPLK